LLLLSLDEVLLITHVTLLFDTFVLYYTDVSAFVYGLNAYKEEVKHSRSKFYSVAFAFNSDTSNLRFFCIFMQLNCDGYKTDI